MSKFDRNRIKDGWEKLCTDKQTDKHTNRQTDTTKIMVTWPWTKNIHLSFPMGRGVSYITLNVQAKQRSEVVSGPLLSYSTGKIVQFHFRSRALNYWQND